MKNLQIEQHKRDILIRVSGKCYIPMFKYSGSNWCFALPVKTMYLMTMNDALKSIETQKNDPNTISFKCDYKIAEIVN